MVNADLRNKFSHIDEFLAFIAAHRSVRKYHPTPIPDKELEEILSAGLRASSAGNLESWSVVVTRDPEIRSKLYELHGQQEMILEAHAVFTFCSDSNRTRRWLDLRGAAQSFEGLMAFLRGVIDAVLAAQNMALAAEAYGLGICYMGTTLRAMDEIGQVLELPRYVVPITSFVIGYPAEVPTPKDRLPLSSVVHYDRYHERSDAAILRDYEQRERDFPGSRIGTNPNLKRNLEKHNITNLAQFYSSPLKYPKELHDTVGAKINAYLERQGFWQSPAGK